MTFITARGDRREVVARSGLSVMEIARRHDLGIEGACEGSTFCATCHVIVDAAFADRLDGASAGELDMLDLALGVQPTSRLRCQIALTEALDRLTVRLPGSARARAWRLPSAVPRPPQPWQTRVAGASEPGERAACLSPQIDRVHSISRISFA